MNLIELDRALKQLRLGGMAAVLETRLRQVTLAGAGWAEQQGIFVARDERASGKIEDQAAIHLLVEGEVEVVEGLLGIAELGLLCSPLQ